VSPSLPLPTIRIGEVSQPPEERRWLVRSLWPAAAVGIIGGAPKACKTWFALDLAVSVASGTPCLGAFAVEQPGRVLAFLAEDSLERTRERVAGMAARRALALADLDLHLIREPALRLDLPRDVDRLRATIERLRPRLLLLDPFVRLHRINENDAGEVSSVLGELRQLQRLHELAVVLVHHARKNGPRVGGEALRGSGDLYAWGDTYASLVRHQDGLRLALEHRDERPIEPLTLRLAADAQGPSCYLEVVAASVLPATGLSLEPAVLAALAAASAPITRGALRTQLKVNNQRLGSVLEALLSRGAVQRTPDGWAPARPFRSDS
jgi:hypothetical protein